MEVICVICLRHIVILLVFIQIISVNGENYVLFTEPVNWYQALINCKNASMELASVHNPEEKIQLDRFLLGNGYTKNYWLAGTKEGNGRFYWATTGARIVYTNWLNAKPEDTKSAANFFEGEHCIAWGLPTYNNSPDPPGWDDVTCSNTLPYICQKNDYCFEPSNIS